MVHGQISSCSVTVHRACVCAADRDRGGSRGYDRSDRDYSDRRSGGYERRHRDDYYDRDRGYDRGYGGRDDRGYSRRDDYDRDRGYDRYGDRGDRGGYGGSRGYGVRFRPPWFRRDRKFVIT